MTMGVSVSHSFFGTDLPRLSWKNGHKTVVLPFLLPNCVTVQKEYIWTASQHHLDSSMTIHCLHLSN